MTERHTDSRSKLFHALREYVMFRKEYLKLDFLEKGSLFLSHMFLILASLLLGCFAILCLSFALAYFLGEWLDSFSWAFMIVAALYVIIIIVLIKAKETLIINPMIRMLDRSLFRNEPNDTPDETEKTSTLRQH